MMDAARHPGASGLAPQTASPPEVGDGDRPSLPGDAPPERDPPPEPPPLPRELPPAEPEDEDEPDDSWWEELPEDQEDEPLPGADDVLEDEEDAEGDDPFEEDPADDEAQEPLDLEDEEPEDADTRGDDPFGDLDDAAELGESPEGAAPAEATFAPADGPHLRRHIQQLIRGEDAGAQAPRLVGRRIFDQVYFRPAGLFAPAPAAVSTQTVVGPRAERPLILRGPLWLRAPVGADPRGRAAMALSEGAGRVGAALSVPQGMDALCEGSGAQVVLSVVPGGGMPSNAALAGAAALELWLAPVRALPREERSLDPHRMPPVGSPKELAGAIEHLRDLAAGLPVGVRILAGDVESDLADVLAADPDFVVLTGQGASMPLAPGPIVSGGALPLPQALVRARGYLDAHRAEVSLVAAGGLRLPMDVAVAVALGAEAVELATVPRLALVALEGEEDLLEGVDAEGLATRVEAMVAAYLGPITTLARARGRADIHDLSRDDVCSSFQDVASLLRIRCQ